MDINGNEVKLEFADADGKVPSFEIPIVNVVNASSRYLLIQPEMVRVASIITSKYYDKAPAEEEYREVTKACDITCIADKSTGQIYRIPGITVMLGESPTEQNGIYYFKGVAERERIVTADMNGGAVAPGSVLS